MSVTVTTPAESRGLTTIATVKGLLGVTSSKFDAEVERVILAVSGVIEEYVGHTFAKQSYSETVAGASHPVLLLTNVPIIGTPVVIVDSSPITDFVVQDALVGSLYRQVGWASAGWVGWGTEPRGIYGTEGLIYSVTYEAGYQLPGQTGRDLPHQIEQACVETAVAWMKREKRDPDIKSKKVGDLAIEYGGEKDDGTSGWSIPASARALLSRRVK